MNFSFWLSSCHTNLFSLWTWITTKFSAYVISMLSEPFLKIDTSGMERTRFFVSGSPNDFSVHIHLWHPVLFITYQTLHISEISAGNTWKVKKKKQQTMENTLKLATLFQFFKRCSKYEYTACNKSVSQ